MASAIPLLALGDEVFDDAAVRERMTTAARMIAIADAKCKTWSLWPSSTLEKYRQAMELYLSAARSYQSCRAWNEAAEAWVKVGEFCELASRRRTLLDDFTAASYYACAGRCYRQVVRAREGLGCYQCALTMIRKGKGGQKNAITAAQMVEEIATLHLLTSLQDQVEKRSSSSSSISTDVGGTAAAAASPSPSSSSSSSSSSASSSASASSSSSGEGAGGSGGQQGGGDTAAMISPSAAALCMPTSSSTPGGMIGCATVSAMTADKAIASFADAADFYEMAQRYISELSSTDARRCHLSSAQIAVDMACRVHNQQWHQCSDTVISIDDDDDDDDDDAAGNDGGNVDETMEMLNELTMAMGPGKGKGKKRGKGMGKKSGANDRGYRVSLSSRAGDDDGDGDDGRVDRLLRQRQSDWWFRATAMYEAIADKAKGDIEVVVRQVSGEADDGGQVQHRRLAPAIAVLVCDYAGFELTTVYPALVRATLCRLASRAQQYCTLLNIHRCNGGSDKGKDQVNHQGKGGENSSNNVDVDVDVVHDIATSVGVGEQLESYEMTHPSFIALYQRSQRWQLFEDCADLLDDLIQQHLHRYHRSSIVDTTTAVAAAEDEEKNVAEEEAVFNATQQQNRGDLSEALHAMDQRFGSSNDCQIILRHIRQCSHAIAATTNTTTTTTVNVDDN